MAAPAPPPPSSLYANPIPFSLFASLVNRIGAIPAVRKGARRSSAAKSKQHRLLEAWVEAVRAEYGRELPEGTVVLFFRLFFPDEGVRRRWVTLALADEVTLTVPRQVRLARDVAGRSARGNLRHAQGNLFVLEQSVGRWKSRFDRMSWERGAEVAGEGGEAWKGEGEGADPGQVRLPLSPCGFIALTCISCQCGQAAR